MPADTQAATIVGEGTLLAARLVGKDLVVLGHFEGSAEVSGVFQIGKAGYARAQVRSKQVEIDGTFEGEVSTGLLILGETAKAHGVFQVGRLRVHDGAVLNGVVKPPGAQGPEEPDLSGSEKLRGGNGDEDGLERWEGEGGPPGSKR